MDSLSYALGVLFATNLQSQGIDAVVGTDLARGLDATFAGSAVMTAEQANALVGTVMAARKEAESAAAKAASEAFLAENAKKPGITTTASGLQYQHITVGNGPSPGPTSKVEVHYRGTLIDGTQFDSSYDRGETITFGLNQVIKGWTEGLQLMKVGGKTRFYIPQDLAYGANPNPNGPIPPYAALIFDVELIGLP
ncbi:MAG: FKBP-type peptidyl-prolyl cis-trans isomerase [Flavobacteriales bacterium]